MKLLLEKKITRDNVANPVREWQSAETHRTHEGQVAFHARMMARIAAAQKPATVRDATVTTIKRRKAGA